jgi:hypothetical protein
MANAVRAWARERRDADDVETAAGEGDGGT